MGVASCGVPRTQQGPPGTRQAHSVCEMTARKLSRPPTSTTSRASLHQPWFPCSQHPCAPQLQRRPQTPTGSLSRDPGGGQGRLVSVLHGSHPAGTSLDASAQPGGERHAGAISRWVRADNWAGALASPGEGLGSGCGGMGSLLSGPTVSSCGAPPAEGTRLSPSLFGQTLFQLLSQTPHGRILPLGDSSDRWDRPEREQWGQWGPR